ncbi:hypothetical protein ELUCI_v1c05070 [Williamsoniiplasma lucivorax]|uniref:Uncharacterized protein n=1 Tax=Williamsoniiplasma lucivorax TaxID=209274 RepID=A0A2S5RE58_9MOLU|nr:hypothetical protein ELUCI_v1c05070 [Williamsoniiplasma lucivorax]
MFSNNTEKILFVRTQNLYIDRKKYKSNYLWGKLRSTNTQKYI